MTEKKGTRIPQPETCGDCLYFHGVLLGDEVVGFCFGRKSVEEPLSGQTPSCPSGKSRKAVRQRSASMGPGRKKSKS